MFEKEAEEWVKENMDCCKTDNSVNQSIPYFDEEERCCAKSAFQDGAEFGYNKANEWHYLENGDYPKEGDVYLIYTTRGVLLGHYEQGGADGETDFRGEPYSDFTEYPNEMLFTEDEIIAWKEIILPELKESE